MTYLYTQSLAYQFIDGKQLFENLSFSINAGITGLVGRNGCGKSVLVKILTGQIKATEGSYTFSGNGTVGYLSQLSMNQFEPSYCIAQHLGIAEKLTALSNVANGSCLQSDFDLIADDWNFCEQLQNQLALLKLPIDPFTACQTLSGGQLQRLLLWNLFRSESKLLILDEPSNHLDKEGRVWLIEQLNNFSGAILLISHDRQLLRETSKILELSSLGIKQYEGQYDDYLGHKNRELSALNQKINDADKQKKLLLKQHQINHEKAQQREAQGKRLRSSGSDSKMALDAKKAGAESATSVRNKQHENQLSAVDKNLGKLKKEQQRLNAQNLCITSKQQGTKRLLDVTALCLPYGTIKPITFTLNRGDKMHILGGNGTGKSTLMKEVVKAQEKPRAECFLHCHCIYLDQHFSLLNDEVTMLENLDHYCHQYTQGENRTLLATIGFRGDRVFQLTKQLSGGEKMRLAMLIVAHQVGDSLLLLDEPDNHLDLDGKLLLANALNNYQGSYMLVSHDDDFVVQAGVSCSYQFN